MWDVQKALLDFTEDFHSGICIVELAFKSIGGKFGIWSDKRWFLFELKFEIFSALLGLKVYWGKLELLCFVSRWADFDLLWRRRIALALFPINIQINSAFARSLKDNFIFPMLG